MKDKQEKLIKLFKKFPGVGLRQAERFVYFLIKQNNGFTEELMREIKNLKKRVRKCRESQQYFLASDDSENISPIVRDHSRNRSQLMIVLSDIDLEAVENANIYNGLYFVLGNYAPIIDNELSKYINISLLRKIVQKRIKEDGLQEIIFALPFTPEAEHTFLRVKEALDDIVGEAVVITQLGRGLSTGSEIEYADKSTLKTALENRK